MLEGTLLLRKGPTSDLARCGVFTLIQPFRTSVPAPLVVVALLNARAGLCMFALRKLAFLHAVGT